MSECFLFLLIVVCFHILVGGDRNQALFWAERNIDRVEVKYVTNMIITSI